MSNARPEDVITVNPGVAYNTSVPASNALLYILRILFGYTIKSISCALGTSGVTSYSYESKTRPIPQKYIEALAPIYGLTADEFHRLADMMEDYPTFMERVCFVSIYFTNKWKEAKERIRAQHLQDE